MADFQLGIIGGCMSHQSGIPMFELYHHHLKKMLDASDDIQLRIWLARDFQESHAERVDKLLARQALDGILLHIRPRFVMKAMLVTAKINLRNGKKEYSLHPFLLNRQHAEGPAQLGADDDDDESPGEETALDASSGTLAEKRHGYLHLHNFNMIAGRLAGLWSWAVEDELFLLDRFIERCTEKGVPFMVLGPWPRGDSPLSVYLCQRLNRRVEARLKGTGAPYCSFEGTGKATFDSMLQRDGLHLTIEGHRHVAQILSRAAISWIRATLGAASQEPAPQALTDGQDAA